MTNSYLLIINPGGLTTKLALYNKTSEIITVNYNHSKDIDPSKYSALDQLDYRYNVINQFLEQYLPENVSLSAIVSRGGPIKRFESGVYKINQLMVDDILEGRVLADHPSNLGAVLALRIADKLNISAFIVDPISVDEFIPEARISGIPQIERKSLFHALNIRMVAHKYCVDSNKDFDLTNLIVCHLGSGISVCAIQNGRVIDVNNANEEGPFSPQRAGTLPLASFTKYLFKNNLTLEQTLIAIHKKAGLEAYLGTSDVLRIKQRIADGDKTADLIMRAMAYQIIKEIGGMSAVLKGDVSAIILTGAMANYDYLIELISERVRFISSVEVYPGENEMLALATGCIRVLEDKEKYREYR